MFFIDFRVEHLKGRFFQGFHPGRLTWNLQITNLERKMLFQTSMIMFHVNLPGCFCLLDFFLHVWFFIMLLSCYIRT